MYNIFIVTAHTGYNYGTYLQAYAMKKFMSKFADNVDIIWEKSLGPNGRDFRINKIVTIIFRTVINCRQLSNIGQGYSKNFKAAPSEKTKALFDKFSKDYLKINELSNFQMRRIAYTNTTKAVITGSDQVWNASSMYPDPLYYLQFVPKLKRIAYAPSFGRATIPNYNKKIIKKYLKSIPAISVREEAGAQIVKDLIGYEAPIVPDPTLIVDWTEWFAREKEDYLLLYFLDEPIEKVILDIKNIQMKTSLKIKVMLHAFDNYNEFEDFELLEGGPKEFVEMISKARFVCTDSFHASIFSMLSHTCFYTYERNYGKVDSQNSRLETLLEHYNLLNRLRKKPGEETLIIQYDMEHISQVRKEDIRRAYKYMEWALNNREALD